MRIDFSDISSFMNQTVARLIDERCEISPDKPLLRFREHRLTATEFRRSVRGVASVLDDLGIHSGDRIVIMAKNSYAMFLLIYACLASGIVAVPLNVASRGRGLVFMLHNAEPRAIFCDEEFRGIISEATHDRSAVETHILSDFSISGIDILGMRDGDVNDRLEANHIAHPGDQAAILYTSGTTGLPKGVMCPQAQFYWWGHNVSKQLEIAESDVLFTTLPLFHTNALNAFCQALVSGAEFSFETRFSASRFWEQATRMDATVTYLLGAMVGILLNTKPTEYDSRHRVEIALSPATKPEHLLRFEDRFGVALIDGYGSTETNAIVSSSRRERRAGYVGKVQPGFTVAVVDEHGGLLPADEPGELVVRNDYPYAFASGYFSLPEETVRSRADLWFHTGDRVSISEDGWVRFVDRIKDVIRRRGENISASEVEAALMENPAVLDAVAYAVPSDLGEEDVMAAVIPAQDAELDLVELRDFCSARLPYFAVPKYFRICERFPTNQSGKVSKIELQTDGIARADFTNDQV